MPERRKSGGTLVRKMGPSRRLGPLGGGGIRTHEGYSTSPDYKSGALDRSATPNMSSIIRWPICNSRKHQFIYSSWIRQWTGDQAKTTLKTSTKDSTLRESYHMILIWREVPEEKYRLLYAGRSEDAGQSTAVGGMRKFVGAMSTTSVPRVGLYCYRTGAQESAGADSGGVRPLLLPARAGAPKSAAQRREEKKGV